MLRNFAVFLVVLLLAGCGGSANRPTYVMAGGSAAADLSGKRYQLGSVRLKLRYVGSSANARLTDEPELNRQFSAFVAREMQSQGVGSDNAELSFELLLDYGRRTDAPPVALYQTKIFDGPKLVAERATGSVEQADVLLQPVEPNTLAERQQLAEIARGVVQQLARVSQ